MLKLEVINKGDTKAVDINKEAILEVGINKDQLQFTKVHRVLSNTQLDLLKFNHLVKVQADVLVPNVQIIAQPDLQGHPANLDRQAKMVAQGKTVKAAIQVQVKLVTSEADKVALSAQLDHLVRVDLRAVKGLLARQDLMDSRDNKEAVDNLDPQAQVVMLVPQEMMVPQDNQDSPVLQVPEEVQAQDQRDHQDQPVDQDSPDSQDKETLNHNQGHQDQLGPPEHQDQMDNQEAQVNLETKVATEAILNIVHAQEEEEQILKSEEVNNNNLVANLITRELKEVNKREDIVDELPLFKEAELQSNVSELPLLLASLVVVLQPSFNVAVLRHKLKTDSLIC